MGFAAEIISPVCYVAVALLLYEIFKPVNRSVSLLAAFSSLAGCTIGAMSSLLALMCLELRAQASGIYMVFFGAYCLLIGYLIVRSSWRSPV